MDWDEADENRWDALQRIVALLLSLAGLVERLAAAGLPLDSRLLLAIGHAELAAKAFIFEPRPARAGRSRCRRPAGATATPATFFVSRHRSGNWPCRWRC